MAVPKKVRHVCLSVRLNRSLLRCAFDYRGGDIRPSNLTIMPLPRHSGVGGMVPVGSKASLELATATDAK